MVTVFDLAHRIRKAMVEANPVQLKGVVEVDETYIGGKQRGWRKKLKNKEVVMGIRSRDESTCDWWDGSTWQSRG